MARSPVTIESLRAMSSLSGLDNSDDKLRELLPQLQRIADDVAGLDALGLQDVEPAIVFRSAKE